MAPNVGAVAPKCPSGGRTSRELRSGHPIGDLPFYDGDLDTPETLPAVCGAWRLATSNADAILWVAPECNYGPSGVLKNALDWASRAFGANGLVGKVSSVLWRRNQPEHVASLALEGVEC